MVNLAKKIHSMEKKIRSLEGRFGQSEYNVEKIVYTKMGEIVSNRNSPALYGIYTALVVDTVDPLKQYRIRFFTPLIHHINTTIKALPWAYPISSMGGFDDSGMTWVPPAGSTACIIFEAGNRAAPYYIGTTWHRDRGPDGEHNWGYNVKEYYDIHEGHRKGFIVGANDGSQVFPPWNTENYNGIDVDSIKDFIEDPEAQKKITYSNIYGFKTPQKHMLKMVDGDYKCSHKNKRMELMSSGGNWLIFKDDFLHEFLPGSGEMTDAHLTTLIPNVSLMVRLPIHISRIKMNLHLGWAWERRRQTRRHYLNREYNSSLGQVTLLEWMILSKNPRVFQNGKQV